MPRSSRSAPSDEELLDRCRSGETEAFAELWERHRRAGIVAARNLAPRFSADDLVSEAYLRIFELTRDGRGPRGAFRPYLYQVIRSIAADWWRVPEHTTDALDEIPDLTEAGPWEDGAFDLNAASQAFATLNERWQAVLWYTEVEGMPPREAAKLLGISANGVSALAARAREALQSAWVEAHVNRELAAAACRSTLQHLQRYQRGKLTRAASRDVAAHLESCDSCSKAAAEYSTLNRQLALVIAGVLLGAGPALALIEGLGPVTAASAVASAAGAATGSSVGSSSGSTSAAGTASAGTASAGTAAGATAISAGAGLLAAPVVVIAAAAAAVAIGGTALLLSGGLRASDAGPTPEATTVSAPPSTETSADTDAGPVSREQPSADRGASREHAEPLSVSNAAASSGASANADGDASGSGGSGSGSGSRADGRSDAGGGGGSSGAASDSAASGGNGSKADATSSGARATARADGAADANGADADGGSDGGTGGSATASTSGGADAGTGGHATANGGSDSSGETEPALLSDSGCWVGEGDAAHYYIWGRTSEPGIVRTRVTQVPEAPVVLPEAMQTQHKNWWWSSNPLTPLSQWLGLVDGDLSDAILELQLTTADGRQSPWTAIEPTDADCAP